MVKKISILFIFNFVSGTSNCMFRLGQSLPRFQQLNKIVGRNLSHESRMRKMRELMDAIGRDDKAKVQKLIKEGASVRPLEPEVSSPIHAIAQKGSVELLELISVNKLPLDSTNEKLETALHIASREGHEDFAKVLLSKGAHVDPRDNNYRTPLHLSAKGGFAGIVDALIKSSAFINASDDIGYSPLVYAAIGNQLRVMELLLKHNPSFDGSIDDKTGNNLMHVIAEKGYGEAFFMLLRNGGNPNMLNKDRQTPLHFAVAVKKNYDVITQLVRNAGVSTDCQDRFGKSPKDIAEEMNDPYLQELLDWDKIKR